VKTSCAPRSGSDLARFQSLGAILPGICGLHCLITPLAIGWMPFLGISRSGEWILFVVSAAACGIALGSTMKAHGRRWVWPLALAGLLVWAGGLAGLVPLLSEASASAVGGLTVASASLLSARMGHRHGCHAC